MDWESSPECTPRAVPDMHEEAERIAINLSSRSVTQPWQAMAQLRCDMLNLPDAKLLELEQQLGPATQQRGISNPLSKVPDTDTNQGYNRLTGEEIVVLTNPFDGFIEMSRLTHLQSFPKDKHQMLYFSETANHMVDHRGNIAAAAKEDMLEKRRHEE